MTEGDEILVTGVALANCLGADSATVFERAFAGVDAFSPASAFFEFPFQTSLGIRGSGASQRSVSSRPPVELANT